jgi:hypothetical protein
MHERGQIPRLGGVRAGQVIRGLPGEAVLRLLGVPAPEAARLTAVPLPPTDTW